MAPSKNDTHHQLPLHEALPRQWKVAEEQYSGGGRWGRRSVIVGRVVVVCSRSRWGGSLASHQLGEEDSDLREGVVAVVLVTHFWGER